MKSDDKHMELIRRYLSGGATHEEVVQLEALMRNDAQLRADFLAYARVDAALPRVIGGDATLVAVESEKAPAPLKKTWTRWVPTAVAAVLLIGAVVTGLFSEKTGRQNKNQEAAIVAEFGELKNCRWVKSDSQIAVGDEIRIGQRIELSSGSAEVLFHTGARLTIVGPAIIEPRSKNGGFLTLGEVHLETETPESKGFTIETPSSTFVDISTAFTASVAPDGLSRLEVTEGEVDVLLDGVKKPKRLKQGETLFVEPGERKIITLIEPGDGTADFRFPTIEPPSAEDYADQSSGNATIHVADGVLRTQAAASGPASVLLDGKGQPQQGAPRQSAFFETGGNGNFLVVLGKAISITKINSYSWHQHDLVKEHRERALQIFTLYGYAGEELPDLSLSPEKSGWTRIARVNSEQFFNVNERLDRPAQQASSITADEGDVGKYRYLLWVTKRNTFYGEFDVFGAP